MRKGEYQLAAGEIDAAIATLERAKDVREKHRLAPDYPVYIYSLLGRAYLTRMRRLEDSLQLADLRKRCRKVIRRGLSLSRRHPNYLALNTLNQGVYLWLSGDRHQALDLFGKSAGEARRIGSGMYEAHACHEAGRCLVGGGPEHLARGKEKLMRALELFKRCGLPPYQAQVERDIEAVSGS
jgi:hypothetical protein